MALWLVRAGRNGEDEQRFLDDGLISLGWAGHIEQDISKMAGKKEVRTVLENALPDAKPGALSAGAGQIWTFAHRIAPGDLVVLPGRVRRRMIHVGEVTGAYVYDPSPQAPYHHHHTVNWIGTDVPRSNFDQDLLMSFGSLLALCEIKRHDAENRVRQMAKNGWKGTGPGPVPPIDGEELDLELLARDRIAELIIAKYKGHRMAELVDAVLQAQGYTTHLSPPGPDKGIDILAAPGPLGFGRTRICVQVKSSDSPVDTPTLSQPIGTMQNVQADQGLLVSWGGFKSSVEREAPAQFFRVRLWDQDDLITELQANYDKLDETLRAELPLKRIWTVAAQEEDE